MDAGDVRRIALVDATDADGFRSAARALVALGATAARALLGRWHDRADGVRVLVTLHPSALLRIPDAEREAACADWLADLAVAADSSAPPQ